jgi:sulfur carrier protein
MNITLNGQSRTLDTPLHVDQLIRELGLEGKRLAVEINHEIVSRSQYAHTPIQDGDQIEILHAIGGG